MSNPIMPLANGTAAGNACTSAITNRPATASSTIGRSQPSFYVGQHPLPTIDTSQPTTWAQRAAAGLAGMRDRAAFHAGGGGSSVVLASEYQESFSLGEFGLVAAGTAAVVLATCLGVRIYSGYQDRSARRAAEPYLSSILSLAEISDPITRGRSAAELLKPVRGHSFDQHMIDKAFRSDSFPRALADLTLFMNSEYNRISSHISDLLLEHLQTRFASHDDPRHSLKELMEASAPFLKQGYDGEPMTFVDAWVQSVEKIEDPRTRFDLYMEGARYVYGEGFQIGLQPLMMRAVVTRPEVIDPSIGDAMDQQLLEVAEWVARCQRTS